jgi:DNA modification methylase
MKKYTLHHGDCLAVLKELPDNSIDSIVTDPPYGLSFMGKKWDYDVPSVEIWAECLRVLKPGGHLLAFAGTRTQHRMAVRIEDAGFEIRDMIAWVYGSGFPKSLDVSKAIDKAAGAEREVLSETFRGFNAGKSSGICGETVPCTDKVTAPATESAKQWQGWGTALKPALEPITVARKPLMGTVAENVLEHGTGGLNIDGCRVGTDDVLSFGSRELGDGIKYGKCKPTTEGVQHSAGRWPANLIHDGSDEVVGLFPDTGASRAAERGIQQRHDVASPDTARPKDGTNTVRGHNDNGGSAARFFYCAKASKRDRDEGLEGLPLHDVYSEAAATPMRDQREQAKRANHHPTVKPTDLMRYLCRLVTPPGGVVLDPFMGSGSTGKAAIFEGFEFVGIEREDKYLEICKARIEAANSQIESAEAKDARQNDLFGFNGTNPSDLPKQEALI